MSEIVSVSLQKRSRVLTHWLESFAPYIAADQKHLEAYSPEQAYWHFGYLAALQDALALLKAGQQGSGIEDNAS
jgi:hypothetical protein